jgi:hypothetical protein
MIRVLCLMVLLGLPACASHLPRCPNRLTPINLPAPTRKAHP